MSSISKAAVLKAHQYPFWLLEVLFPKATCSRDAQSLWASHNGNHKHSFATHLVRLTLASSRVNSWIPLSLLKYKSVLFLYNLMALEYIVHQCQLEPPISMALMCQAIESMQSNKPNCPFPLPSRRQGSSSSDLCIHNSSFVCRNQKAH